MSKLPPLPLMLRSMIPEDQIDVMKWGAACRAAALEEAARVCEGKVEREAGYNGQWEGYGKVITQKTGEECADAIRALRDAS